MGKSRQKNAMESNARSQERIATTQERTAAEQAEFGREDREYQQRIRDELGPLAELFIGAFDPDKVYGKDVEFPEFDRPDFTGMIRRDYFDDLDSIEQGQNRNVARAEETLTASGLARSGIRTGGLGAIMRGGEAGRSLARRNMQGRMEGESRDAYADTRDLTLREHADKRSLGSERANLAVAGANIKAGQQATFSPQPWFAGSGAGYNSSVGSLGNASSTRYAAAQLPTGWSVAGGIAGAALNAGANYASGGGLGSVWRGSGRR